jgi:hypothetical protein
LKAGRGAAGFECQADKAQAPIDQTMDAGQARKIPNCFARE